MSQKTKFAKAAKACRGISSRKARNSCVASHLRGSYGGHGHARRHGRGSKGKRRRAFQGMTKKDYIETAKILRGSGCSQLADDFASMFARDNPRFDRERFKAAVHGS